MNFQSLSKILPKSKVLIAQNPKVDLKNLSTDSREGCFLENTLFFALVGERRNGHDFIQEVIQKGGRNFVISENIDIEELLKNVSQNQPENHKNIALNIIKVQNTLYALQRIAQTHRENFEYPVIAITGSNGKTIIKEWLSEILQNLGLSVVKSPKSYNSQIGVPLSVWQMSNMHNIGVFEAGISQVNEMQNLEKILQPNFCIFSNIGEAHKNGFPSHIEKIKQKLFLAKNTQKLIFNLKYTQLNEVVDILEKESFFENPMFQKIIWGESEIIDQFLEKNNPNFEEKIQYNSDLNSKYYKVSYKPNNTHKKSGILIHCVNPIHTNLSPTYLFAVPFKDEASLENIAHILVFLLDFLLENIDKAYQQNQQNGNQEKSTVYYEKSQNVRKNIENSIENLQPVQMRLQRKAGVNYCTLIDDTYNNDLEGLKIALDFTATQHNDTYKRKILVLSAPANQQVSVEIYSDLLATYLWQYVIDVFVGIGDFFTENRDFMLKIIENKNPNHENANHINSNHSKLKKIIFLNNTTDFFTKFTQKDFFQDIILIKGARKYQFEQIINFLQEKTHRTTLEINLNALTHNLNFYKSLIKPYTKIMVMVKAFAYGTGRTEVAQLLQHNGVDYLAVAYTDEAVALRKEGITIPIMVMNPTEEDFPKIITYNIEPEIYSFELLEKWFFYCKNTQKTDFAIHLKLDTGMKRLGFESDEINLLCDFLRKNLPKNALIKSIFTHLAGADDAFHNDFSLKQIDVFLKNAKIITNPSNKINRNMPKPFLHLVNSAGIVRFPEAHFDMVRLGIGLYGIETNEIFADKLQAITTLKTHISQIKKLKKGESVGYSRTHIAQENTQIATIAIGYADGLNRLLSNENGEVWIKNKLCKIVGRICMDMCMVDIGNLVVEVGEEVEIFGKNISVQSIAKKINTIPYEILTSIGERVKRVFFTE